MLFSSLPSYIAFIWVSSRDHTAFSVFLCSDGGYHKSKTGRNGSERSSGFSKGMNLVPGYESVHGVNITVVYLVQYIRELANSRNIIICSGSSGSDLSVRF